MAQSAEEYKEAKRKSARRWKALNPTKRLDYMKKCVANNPEKYREMHREVCRRARELHPEKMKARGWVSSHLRSGAIHREPCVICGEPRTEAHHQDYTKPSEITWLCKRHHGGWHRILGPE